jgi:hypothetical protein
MKNIFLTLAIILIVSSCSKNSKHELTDEQKASIKGEIQRLFQYSGDGVTELNAEKTFSTFSNQKGTKYIRNGHIYPDIETAKKEYAGWWKSPDAVRQSFVIDTIIFDFLDEKTVLMTAVASLLVINDTTGRKPWDITYTGVWRKEDAGWKIFLMHNSWE